MIFKPLTKRIVNLILSLLLLLSFSAQARTLVLVHGYSADGMSWRKSGFTRPLLAAGWQDGGGYGYSPQSMLIPRLISLKGDVFFTVELPSQAAIKVQENLLVRYLEHLYSQRLESISLVGHSAGGIVARLYTLDPVHQPVNGLITIAAPHLGTPAANMVHLVGNSPIGVMVSMVGGQKLQNSRGLFSDLKEEKPYNFLYWMNHQLHPEIHYASIIRNNRSVVSPSKFDFVVPHHSQNMNNVWALRNRSGVARTTENHSLNSKDGAVTLEVLKHIK